MFSVACVSFDGNQCRIHLKHFSQLWEAVLWNRTRQHRGSYPTLQTSPTLSSSSTHTEEKWFPSPSKLCVPCLPEPSLSSCGSRCLLQKTSPPHSHQEHSCPLPSKQLIPSFLPSLRRQLPNSLVCSCMSGDGQGEESRAGLLLLPLLEAMVSRGQCSATRLPFQQQLSLCSSLSCSSRNKTFLVSVQNFGLHGSRSDASHLLGPCPLNQLEREEQETQLFPSYLGASCAASLQ